MQIFDFLAGLRSKVTSCGTPKTTPNLIKILRANSECHAPHLMLEAADEIELLRIGVAEALRERDEANATIGTLRAERDEARREICEGVAAISASVNAKQWAQERGWDCYKKEDK